jgi:hypothetical protein
LPSPPGASVGEHAPVSVDAFWKAHPDDRRQIIPPVPGVYVWTYNTMRLITSDEKIVEERLLNLLKIVGRNQSQKVGPYALMTVRDERKEISPERSVLLHQRFAHADDFGRWVAALAVHIQRPLYVGKAVDLNKRITDHMRGRTNLKAYVEDRRHPDGAREFDCSMLDLVVTWYAAPHAVAIVDTGEGDGGIADDVDADVDDEEGIVDDLDPGPEPPQPNADLERWLYAAESLLIRLAMPMLNEAQT